MPIVISVISVFTGLNTKTSQSDWYGLGKVLPIFWGLVIASIIGVICSVASHKLKEEDLAEAKVGGLLSGGFLLLVGLLFASALFS